MHPYGCSVLLFEDVMSKVVNKSQFKRARVLSALSMVVLAGCQTTGQYTGGLTKTNEVNLLPYSTHIRYSFNYDDELNFELPLADITDCPTGWSGNLLEGKTGTLTITKIEKDFTSNVRGFMYGYVSSDQYDVSKCRASVEFKESEYKRAYSSKSYINVVIPKLKELQEQSVKAEKEAELEQLKKLEAEDRKTWHVRELTNTAKGVAMIKVCMEKGTYFLSIDKGAQKVIRDSESYARNDIHSKVTNKHYFDKTAYQNAYQQELKVSRLLWKHDYLTFSEQCATMRNIVDSYINQ